MSEMIERVAQAIGAESDGTWEGLTPSRQRFHRDCARAAIEAMREPTDAMREAGFDAAMDNVGGDVIGTIEVQTYITKAVWRAMLKAALAT